MKETSKAIAWALLSLAFLYLPFCFSALSFNPLSWNHTERFIFALFVWIGIIFNVIKKYIPIKYNP